MSKIKHKFSSTIHVNLLNKQVGVLNHTETFEASEADSWEEARKEVQKGVYDRLLEVQKQNEEWAKENGSSSKHSSGVTTAGDQKLFQRSEERRVGKECRL